MSTLKALLHLFGWRIVTYNVRWSDTHKRLNIRRQIEWQNAKNNQGSL